MGLFRDEALSFAERRLEGSVFLSVPLRARYISLAVLAFLSLAIVGASFATYEQRVTAQGVLLPTRGLVRIYSQSEGVIDRLPVVEGTAVKKGEVLAEIKPFDRALLATDGSPVDPTSLEENLIAVEQSAVITREKADILAIEADIGNAIMQLASTQAQLDSSKARIAARERAVELAEAEFGRASSLAERGFLARAELSRREESLLNTRSELVETNIDRMTLEGRISEIRSQILAQRERQRARSAETQQVIAGLDARRIMNRSRRSSMVIAPVPGVVATLPTQAGQTIRSDQTLAILIPEDDTIEVEVFVPVSAAGLLNIGQEVRVNYDAYPFERFGAGKARIRNISSSVLQPGEATLMPEKLDVPTIRIRATLERQDIDAYGVTRKLKPGMTAQVDLVVSKRTLLQWLFDPIIAIGRSI